MSGQNNNCSEKAGCTPATSFDRYADKYDYYLESCLDVVCHQNGAFFHKLKACYIEIVCRKQKLRRILDFGCGNGGLSAVLVQNYPEAEIVGYDVSSRQIASARERYKGRARLSFTEELRSVDSYDLVVTACVLHHVKLEDRLDLLMQLLRFVGETGRLIVFEHNPLNPVARYIVDHCRFDQDVALIYPCQLKRLARQAGLTIDEMAYVSIFPWATGCFRKVEWFLRHLPLGAQYMMVLSKGKKASAGKLVL